MVFFINLFLSNGKEIEIAMKELSIGFELLNDYAIEEFLVEIKIMR